METPQQDKPKGRASRDSRDGGERQHGCNCRKSKCLKLYCECFAASKLCVDAVCKCQDCHNNEDHMEERTRACEETVRKNARAFEPKIAKEASQADDPSHRRGCRCKKSHCLKRYCECFNGKVKCTQVCRCVNCKNDGSSIEQHDDSTPKRKAKPESEEEAATAADTKESPTTPKKEGELDRQMNAQMYMMSPHMTPLLEGAGWQDGLLTGAFPCSPLRAEDLANLMPPHMQTPQQQEGPPGGVPAFSPALLPIDDIDPNEPMSFLISPGKSGTPFKISPMKNTTAMHPPPVAPLHLRSSLDSRKATAISPFAKDVQKLVGGCFSSPQKAVFHPNGSTAPDAPPSGLMPAHTARRISPRKRPGVFSDGKPPRAPTTPQPHSPPVKKARTAPERSPQVSPLWSRSPMNVKPDLKGEDAALSFLASPLGLRGDQTETPSMRRSGPNFTNIDMSPMCTRMCDAPGGVNIISGGEQSSTPQLRPTSNIAPDSAKNLWQSRGGAPATVQ